MRQGPIRKGHVFRFILLGFLGRPTRLTAGRRKDSLPNTEFGIPNDE